jgi:predicted CXXCH cytochrome family protein
VLKNEIHTGLDEMACTDCHNPHGGSDRYILY